VVYPGNVRHLRKEMSLMKTRKIRRDLFAAESIEKFGDLYDQNCALTTRSNRRAMRKLRPSEIHEFLA
jgi:tRNA G37 N-methylase TrmD